jgi:MFS transporter, DHA1 family, multidrug resistance protein
LQDEEDSSSSESSPELTSHLSGLSGSLSEKNDDVDGHRPTLLDLQESRTRSRRSLARGSLGRQASSATGQDIRRTVSRRESAISRIRSRPVYHFTHPLEHIRTSADQLVDFDGPDDPYHPLNWPIKKKVITTALYGIVTMSATWASSSYSSGTRAIAREFKVGVQVANVGTTLFLLGFGTGPLLWAPLSEVYGRRVAVLVPMFVAICFSFGSATAKDLQTLMITRFFGGFFASAPVTNTGGVLGDMFTPATRGIAIAGYAMAVVGGPVLGESPKARHLRLSAIF